MMNNCTFVDGDSYHSKENIAKMSNKIPLTDKDRLPWLKRIRIDIANTLNNNNDDSKMDDNQYKTLIIACSALKLSYRNVLRGMNVDSLEDMDDQLNQQQYNNNNNNENLWFCMLDAKREDIERRISSRNSNNHFMPQALLDSQFNTLEFPDPKNETNIIIQDMSNDGPIQNAQSILQQFQQREIVMYVNPPGSLCTIL